MDSIIHSVSMETFSASPDAFSQEIGKWFETYGFAIISNHGVDQNIIDNVENSAKAFFALDEEIKKSYIDIGHGGQRGYTSFGVETAKDHKIADLKEFWHHGRILPQNHKYKEFMRDNIEVSHIKDFNSNINEMFEAFDLLGKNILKAIAIYLKLEPDFFDNTVNQGNSILRLLHYPPVIGDIPAGAIRAGAHGDINVITLLLGADEPGLQLLDRNNEWQNVTAPKGSIAVNIGDMLSRLTNNKLPSTIHRVINPNPERSKFSRYSMPFFLHFNPDYIIETLPNCGTSKFEPISAQDFLMQRLREINLA